MVIKAAILSLNEGNKNRQDFKKNETRLAGSLAFKKQKKQAATNAEV